VLVELLNEVQILNEVQGNRCWEFYLTRRRPNPPSIYKPCRESLFVVNEFKTTAAYLSCLVDIGRFDARSALSHRPVIYRSWQCRVLGPAPRPPRAKPPPHHQAAGPLAPRFVIHVLMYLFMVIIVNSQHQRLLVWEAK